MSTGHHHALQSAIQQIERAFGKGSLQRWGDQGRQEDVEVISTGSLGLDIALGIGGLVFTDVPSCRQQLLSLGYLPG